MAKWLRDPMDFSAYKRDTESASKVRRASDFDADLDNRFAPRPHGPARSSMSSTKLRGRIEFRPAELTAWAGYSGHRKSMFTGQVALDLVAQDEPVLMISLEMDPVETLKRMAMQASATAVPSKAWRQQFSRWTNGRLWLFDHIGRISPDLCIAVCRYFADECKGRHVFVDSMMMVCTSEESIDEQKQFVTDLVRCAQETRLHVHLITHCRKPHTGSDDKPPTKYDLRGSAAISDQAHNVITVWQNKPKQRALDKAPGDEVEMGKPDAIVTIEKQRNGPWEGMAQLWFDAQSLRFCDDRISAVEPYAVEFA